MSKESYAAEIISNLRDANIGCDEELLQIYAYLTV
jgi:hypothetical protein